MESNDAMDADGFVIKSKVPNASVEFPYAMQGLVKIAVQRNANRFLCKPRVMIVVSGAFQCDSDGKLK